MKKSLVGSMLIICCAGAYGQGTVEYVNDASTQVLVLDRPPFGPAQAGQGYEVEMFYQPDNGGAAPASITLSGQLGNWLGTSVTGIIVPGGGGIFDGPNLTLTGIAGGANVWLEIVGWDDNAPSYAAAVSGGADDFAASTVWSQATGNPNGSPPTTPASITSAGDFQGLIFDGPEPSTLALGSLGAATLLFLRPRKKSN